MLRSETPTPFPTRYHCQPSNSTDTKHHKTFETDGKGMTFGWPWAVQ